MFQAIMDNYCNSYGVVRIPRSKQDPSFFGSPRHNVKARNVSVAAIYLQMHRVYRGEIYIYIYIYIYTYRYKTGIYRGGPSAARSVKQHEEARRDWIFRGA